MLDNIRRLCKEKHIPMVQLEKQAGLGFNTLVKWDRSSPSIDRVAAVADVLGVTIDELLGRAPKGLTKEENEAVRLFNTLNAEGQTAAIVLLRFLSMQPAYIKNNHSDEAI